MSADYFLTRLRELFYTPPSAESWAALCALFNKWPWGEEEGLDLGLQYAQDHLDSWPDHLRVPPERWLVGLLRNYLGERARIHHAWPIVRVLKLSTSLQVEDRWYSASRLSGRALKGTDWMRLMASEHLGLLTRLHLSGYGLNHDVVRALAESHHIQNLTHLELANFSGHIAEALIRAPWLPNLTHLNLRSNFIGPEGARTLSKAPFGAISFLNLAYTDLGLKGVEALSGGGFLGSVAFLNLDGMSLGDEALILLAATDLPELTHLRLCRNRLTVTGLRALIDSPIMSRLVHLNLSNNDLDDTAAAILGLSPQASGLRYLNVANNPSLRRRGRLSLINSRHLHPDAKKRIKP